MDLWDRFWRAAVAPWLEVNPLHESLLLEPSQPEFISRKQLLGFFYQYGGHHLGFTPMLDDNTPVKMPNNIVDRFFFIGCRHGVALLLDNARREAILWDPINGDHHRVPFPRGFGHGYYQRRSAAVLCSAGEDHHPHLHGNCDLMKTFKLVMVWQEQDTTTHQTETFACLYDSRSDAWGDTTISMTTSTYAIANVASPSVMVGNNALHWLLSGANILEFDTEKKTLAVIEKPSEYAHITGDQISALFQILRREDNSLGLAALSPQLPIIQLWERDSSSSNNGDDVSWALQETIQLDEFILWLPCERRMVRITGYEEETNVIFLSTFSRDFTFRLETKQLTYIGTRDFMTPTTYYPYTTNFYAPVMGVAGGAENVNT